MKEKLGNKQEAPRRPLRKGGALRQAAAKRGVSIAAAILAGGLPVASCSQNGPVKSAGGSKKILVAFFSRAGENYAVGNVAKGNTHIVAEMIAAETGGTLFRIEPATPYPDSYKECTEAAKAELGSNARPAVKGDIAAEDYDVVFIGYPIWWGDMPMPVYTFIEKHQWEGKTVIPFCTHEGSGLSGTEGRLESACEGSAVLEGLAIQGSVAQKQQKKAKESVTNWLKKIGY